MNPVDTLSFDHQEAERDPRVGRVLGNYHVLSRIGEGGFGVVYRARDVKLDRFVALKFLRQPLRAGHHARFAQEARTLAALRHPHIVQVFAWETDGDTPCFVTELFDESAAARLAAHAHGLPPEEAVRIVTEAAEGLAHAHAAGVIHGDIKPENILLEAGTGRAVLADFGLAQLARGLKGEASPGIAGSPPYMAPEQLAGGVPDVRADIYALGATFYRLLTGEAPFRGSAPEVQRQQAEGAPTLSEAVPPRLGLIVSTAMAASAAGRYPHVDAFLKALRMASAPETPAVVRPHRSRVAWGIAGAALVVAVVVAGVLMPAWRELRGEPTPAVLAEAKAHLEEGELDAARAGFEAYLVSNPASDDALYGLGYSLLLEGDAVQARAAFDQIHEAALRAEGLAAAVHATGGAEARHELEAASEQCPNGYQQVLLAGLELADGAPAQAAARLEQLAPEGLRYAWQRNQYLQTLGQAYFRAGDFPHAVQVFSSLADAPVQAGADSVSADYLDLSRRQLDDVRRTEVSAQIARVKALLNAAAPVPEAVAWTSRPMAVWLAPARTGSGPIALGSGLADLLTWKLGSALLARDDIPLVPVQREMTAEILAEQELSTQLSPEDNQVRVGQVLGARLYVRTQFATLFGEESLRVSVVDTETTREYPVGEYAVTRAIEPSAWVARIAGDLWQTVLRNYPLRGRLTPSGDGWSLNFGSEAGVAEGMRFKILGAPESGRPMLGQAVVESVSAGDAQAVLEGELSQAMPEGGWYVEAMAPQQARGTPDA